MTTTDFYATNVRIRNVERRDRCFDVDWDDGEVSHFHFVWLRDNCHCELCHDTSTHQKMVWLVDIPVDIAPAAMTFSEDAISIQWNHGAHESRFGAKWLRANCYSDRGRTERRFKPVLWHA